MVSPTLKATTGAALPQRHTLPTAHPPRLLRQWGTSRRDNPGARPLPAPPQINAESALNVVHEAPPQRVSRAEGTRGVPAPTRSGESPPRARGLHPAGSPEEGTVT